MIESGLEQKLTLTRNVTVKPPRAPACISLVSVRVPARTVTRTASCALKREPVTTRGRSFVTRSAGPVSAPATEPIAREAIPAATASEIERRTSLERVDGEGLN